jgi:hypothetical protein
MNQEVICQLFYLRKNTTSLFMNIILIFYIKKNQYSLLLVIKCVDLLTKTEASSNDTLKIWNSYPPQLSLMLLVDVVGVVR